MQNEMFVLWITGTASVLLIVYIWATWNLDYWKKHGIPYVKPTFLFGSLKDYVLFRKNIGEVYDELYWKCPDEPAVGVFKLGSPQLMLRDIDLIKTVCNKEFNSFRNYEVNIDSSINPTGASNPFLATGDLWKKLRNLHAGTQSTGKLRSVYPYISNVCKNMVDYVGQHENINLEAKNIAMLYTTDILSSCLFSMNTNSFINSKHDIHKSVVKYFKKRTFFNTTMMFLSLVPWPTYLLRLRSSTKGMSDYLIKIIKDLFENPRNDISSLPNFVRIMANDNLHSHDYKFTYEELANHSITYFSGLDSISTELALTLYLLALHPEVQRNLRKEIKETKESEINFDILHKMQCLDAVVNETMRLYPTCLVSRRVCTQDIVLKCAGREYPIKKGMTVSIPYFSLHRDGTYFPEPMKYNPERFYNNEDIPSQFLPFGTGPRICFGAKFSSTAIKSGVFHIVKNFEISLRGGDKPRMPVFGINSLIPTPRDKLWLTLRKLQ